ncbi:fimbria/pilus outer membrane usher protein [Escherichia albertii]|uniref:fimbria/pilus outer membrane usher protein n=1 Tax=Escherichia albertii TaxID=208962 RepID=UPI0032B790ED
MYKKNIILTCILVNTSFGVSAEDFFDPSLLDTDAFGEQQVDLSVFSRPGGGIEGQQEVSIYVNDNFYLRTTLNFKNDDNGVLSPVFNGGFFKDLLTNYPFTESNEETFSSADFQRLIPYSNIKFEQAISRVYISIPQAYLSKIAHLKSSPENWSTGIPAMLMDYRISGSNNESKYDNSDSLYISSSLGLNLLGVRLRTSSYYSYYRNKNNIISNTNEQFGFYNTYLEKDIGDIGVTFRLGELSTGSVIQDPVSFRGVRLFTNDDMLRDSLRSYVPVIRGFANSQSVVTIEQNGRIVYQTNVPAGPFELSDFFLSGYSGDLLVNVREADGKEHSFIQPFSILPEMKREGVSGFELSAGRYDNTGNSEYYNAPSFIYGSWSRGFSHGITFFGSTLYANGYQQVGAGSTLSLDEFGAISGDVSFSRAKKDNDTHNGQSFGLKYSKSRVESGTTLTLATYRYSTKDFYSFRNFASKTNSAKYLWDNKLKNRLTISLSQSLDEYGHISLSASQQDYWTTQYTSRSASLSHSFNWNDIYFSSSFTMDFFNGAGYDNTKNKQLDFYISMPLDKLFGEHKYNGSSLNYSTTKAYSQIRHTATLSGKVPETKSFYRISNSWGNNNTDSHALSLSWNGDYFGTSVGYTRSGSTRTYDYNLSGGAIMYPWGIAFGASNVIDGAAIVQTKGTSGVNIQQGGKTSFLGNAIVSSVRPYTENRVDIEPEGLADDTVLAETTKRFIPEKGAVTLLDYKIFKGHQVIFKLKNENGEALPFGTIVSLEDVPGNNTGIVGDDGRVYFAGVPSKGKLVALWGKDKKCTVLFNIGEQDKKKRVSIEQQTNVCYR